MGHAKVAKKLLAAIIALSLLLQPLVTTAAYAEDMSWSKSVDSKIIPTTPPNQNAKTVENKNDLIALIATQSTNKPPVVTDITLSVQEDRQVGILDLIKRNTKDTDNHVWNDLNAIITENPAHGKIVTNEKGQLFYVPDANYNGVDSFKYVMNDGKAVSNVGTASVKVAAVADAPVLDIDIADRSKFTAGREIRFTVKGINVDNPDVATSIYSIQIPKGATFDSKTGEFVWTPTKSMIGTYELVFGAKNGALSAKNKVTVLVSNNEPPLVTAPSISTKQGESVNVSLNIQDNDSEKYTYRVLQAPQHGTIAANTNPANPGDLKTIQLVYTPDVNYFGADDFSVVVNDGIDDSMPVKITITVEKKAENPKPPVVQPYTPQDVLDSLARNEGVLTISQIQSSYFSATESETARVSWKTDLPGTAIIQYGETTEYGSFTPHYFVEKGQSTYRDVIMYDLKPNTVYHARVISCSDGKCTASEDFTIKTAPTPPATNRIFEVGEGQQYADLINIPWSTLGPGDTVKIHWRSTPYNEGIILSNSGTKDFPIRIIGVPGPLGQLPVIDGKDAVYNADMAQNMKGGNTLQGYGAIIVAPKKSAPYLSTVKYVEIANLDVRNAYKDNTFTSYRTENGQLITEKKAYGNAAASIYLYGVEHVKISNTVITGSGNGIFSHGYGPSRDILIENSKIYGNGTVGSDRQHNVYTEAIGIVYRGNSFGHLRPGAIGSNLKDRSTGTVIENNLFNVENFPGVEQGIGGCHVLDLVEPEDSVFVSMAIRLMNPALGQTKVTGNTIINPANGASTPIHFGGDNGNMATYRRNLDFENNIFINEGNQTAFVKDGVKIPGRWRITLFALEDDRQVVKATGNTFINKTLNPDPKAKPQEFAITRAQGGSVEFGEGNKISQGWVKYATNAVVPNPYGMIKGLENLIEIPIQKG